MPDKILNEIEELVGTDDFEYEAEMKMEQLEETGAGIEAVTPLLQIMERHPLDDFGAPGPLVQFAERFYKNGYEEKLIESLKRRPAVHTLLMLNRIINGSDSKDEYIALLKEVSERADIEEEIKNSAQEFIDYQNSK
ncbi:MAG: hypothetical protein Q4E74_04925 [Ruminococcus sp.]|nr:hypothetical protein [Ruminococcus sp.]